jgi:UDP-N-acetylmuramate: L-alanyl-gamma-D-glutamyl-meso-diaminopimelate ligase
MHIHILGICGTFMGGIAALAKTAGHEVTGSDSNIYPPMSTQLKRLGIEVIEGYDADQLSTKPDCVVIGNALSRGNAAVEAVLNRGMRYSSGPQWLAENVLGERHVIAVAGTHGKTTTACMLAWILHDAGLKPGFLIGGIASNLDVSARFGGSKYFVVEADEYDTAFFDKRSKFVHYHPRTLVLNNLEFDHADIFDDIDAIKWQFHQLVRTVPGKGRIICKGHDNNLQSMLDMGCWSPVETFGTDRSQDWSGQFLDSAERRFSIRDNDGTLAQTHWKLGGLYNLENAIAAIAAARSAGVPLERAIDSMSRFDGVKRRLERTATVSEIAIYDDFAHHPTAIRRTIARMKRRYPGQRLVIVIEPRSNSMRLGVHNEAIADALEGADMIALYRPEDFPPEFDASLSSLSDRLQLFSDYEKLAETLGAQLLAGDQVVFMSNGGFGAVRQKLTMALQKKRQA